MEPKVIIDNKREGNRNSERNRKYFQFNLKANSNHSKNNSININQKLSISNLKERPAKPSYEKKSKAKIRNIHFNKNESIEKYIKCFKELKNLTRANSIKIENQNEFEDNENKKKFKEKFHRNISYVFNAHCFHPRNLSFLHSHIHNTKLSNNKFIKNIMIPNNKNLSPSNPCFEMKKKKDNNKLVQLTSSPKDNLLNSQGLKSYIKFNKNGIVSPPEFSSFIKNNNMNYKSGTFYQEKIRSSDLNLEEETKNCRSNNKNRNHNSSIKQVCTQRIININPKKILNNSSIFFKNPRDSNQNNSAFVSSFILPGSVNQELNTNRFNSSNESRENEAMLIPENEFGKPNISTKSFIKPIINKAQCLYMHKKNDDNSFIKIQSPCGDTEKEIEFN